VSEGAYETLDALIITCFPGQIVPTEGQLLALRKPWDDLAVAKRYNIGGLWADRSNQSSVGSCDGSFVLLCRVCSAFFFLRLASYWGWGLHYAACCWLVRRSACAGPTGVLGFGVLCTEFLHPLLSVWRGLCHLPSVISMERALSFVPSVISMERAFTMHGCVCCIWLFGKTKNNKSCGLLDR